MKVLYDISILGMGYYAPAQTGIFRVVENIAYGLADSKECELNFCSSHSLANLSQVIGYLGASPTFENISLSHPHLPKILYKNISDIVRKINVKSEAKLTRKVLRTGLYYSLRLLGKTIKPLTPKEFSAVDLFHSPFLPFPDYLKNEGKTQKIITIHDLISIIYPQFFANGEDSLMKKVVHNIGSDDWAICVSNSTKNDFCNYRSDFDPARIFVIHLAASDLFFPCGDDEKIRSVKKKYRVPDGPYILSLNTLEPRKNMAHTIRTFAQMVEQEKIRDLSLVLVGTKGWLYDEIFEELSKIPMLKNRIIVTGFAANEDLAALYSGAVAFVYPSFYEGFGLPPLEAMQCGVPVITSNTSSLPEVVGDAGIMVSPTDGDSLCQSMLDIYKSDSLRKSMSLKSIEQAKKFSWEKCVNETIAAYKTTLKS